MIAAWCGDFEAAASLSAEDDALKQATGTRISPYGAMLLAAYQGRTAEASTLIDATDEDAVARGEGLGVTSRAGRPRSSTTASAATRRRWPRPQQASDEHAGLFISDWALPELIEAAVRTREDRSSPPMRSSGSPRPRTSATPTGRSGSRHARGRC